MASLDLHRVRLDGALDHPRGYAALHRHLPDEARILRRTEPRSKWHGRLDLARRLGGLSLTHPAWPGLLFRRQGSLQSGAFNHPLLEGGLVPL